MCESLGNMAIYGYARVSTDGQSLTAQLAELKAANCEKVFQEKVSGARSDRKQLARLMAVLAKGDVLVVTRLDRLARSTRDLLNTGSSRGMAAWFVVIE
jgi:DNA invertase Pin-like site-specific DNA recombinase